MPFPYIFPTIVPKERRSTSPGVCIVKIDPKVAELYKSELKKTEKIMVLQIAIRRFTECGREKVNANDAVDVDGT